MKSFDLPTLKNISTNGVGEISGSLLSKDAKMTSRLQKSKTAEFSPRSVKSGVSSFESLEKKQLSFADMSLSVSGDQGFYALSYQRQKREQPPQVSCDFSVSLKSPETTKKIKQLESFMTTNCAHHISEPQRCRNILKVLDDVGRIYPLLSNILLILRRYLKNSSVTLENMHESKRCDEKGIEKRIYKKYESFFEEKILQLLCNKRKAENTINQLREEVYQLRRERDNDLMKAKETVMIRLNECERKEDEFNAFRKLVASVFKTNETLVNRVEELELVLQKHRIDIPRANEDLYLYNKPKSDNARGLSKVNEVKKITEQVPLAFIEASREEMNLARLSLQKELLNSAFDDRTAYRLQINCLRNTNSSLQIQVETLQNQVEILERYIYEKRFLTSDGGTDHEILTPRPKDVPFSVQTDLGIDLKNTTSQLVAELAVVGINLKQQLNSAVMTLRQLTYVLEWMNNETILQIVENEVGAAGVIPTFPAAAWGSIPHFLRTNIEPHVLNLGWSDTDVAALLFDFFSNYWTLRTACASKRDAKMLVPPVYKLFERCQNHMVRLDATQSEINKSEENVPFGYVVSYFISNMLKTATAESNYTRLIQPGTLNPFFLHAGKRTLVEMEFEKCSYNLWYHSLRYKKVQPLCRLFLDIVDGKLPVSVFNVMQRVLRSVEARIRKSDVDGSGSFTYNKLVSTVLKVVADMDVQVGRGAVLAAMETFKANNAPIVSGRIMISDILAVESNVVQEDMQQSFRPPTSVVASTNRRSCVHEKPQGASVLTRFWRRLVIRRYEWVYSMIEEILGPLVVESQVVIGLFLLPVSAALTALKAHDTSCTNLGEGNLNSRHSKLLETIRLQKSVAFLSEVPSVQRLTEEYETKYGIQKVAKVEAKSISLEKVFLTVLQDLQLLSRSMHFPGEHDEEVPVQSQKATEQETTLVKRLSFLMDEKGKDKSISKVKRVKRRRRKKVGLKEELDKLEIRPSLTPDLEEVVPTKLTVQADNEMTEWFGFCCALRQTSFAFCESIFLDDSVSSEDNDKTPQKPL